jgi:hypothetical protein
MRLILMLEGTCWEKIKSARINQSRLPGEDSEGGFFYSGLSEKGMPAHKMGHLGKLQKDEFDEWALEKKPVK